MYNGRTRLIILLLGDPHLLEGGERREDGAADPHGVLVALRGAQHTFSRMPATPSERREAHRGVDLDAEASSVLNSK